MAALSSIVRQTQRYDFGRSFILPPRLSFTRSGTADYRDQLGATITAPANTPRLGVHPSNNNLRQGLVLTTGEVCGSSDTADWLLSSAGTMLWVGSLASLAVSTLLWGVGDGTSSNYHRVRMDSSTAGRLRLSSTVGGAAQYTSDLINPMLVDTRYAIAVAWSGTTVQAVVNDQSQVSATSAAGMPTLNTLAVGSPFTGFTASSTAAMDGVIERMEFWPFAMTLTQMRAITRG